MQGGEGTLRNLTISGDDDLRQDCKDLLPSLPRERGLLRPHIYNYKGYWYYGVGLQGLISYQNHFEAQDDDILLVSFPKSGTTWLKAITFALVNRGQYCGVIPQQHPLHTKNPHDLVPFIDFNIYLKNPNPDLSTFTPPRLYATHLPFSSLAASVKASPCKIVYLCRNPKDTFVSYWHFTNKIRSLKNLSTDSIEDVFECFCRGIMTYGPFWDHVLEYWQKSLEMPQRVLFLKYEDLKRQPILHLKKLAEFLDCPFSDEEEKSRVPEEILKLCSFDHLSNLEVNKNGKLDNNGVPAEVFFRRGEVGDWKNFLTEEMVNRLDCLAKDKFEACGLQL